MVRYNEVKNFIKTNKRNPSKYRDEEKLMVNERTNMSEYYEANTIIRLLRRYNYGLSFLPWKGWAIVGSRIS